MNFCNSSIVSFRAPFRLLASIGFDRRVGILLVFLDEVDSGELFGVEGQLSDVGFLDSASLEVSVGVGGDVGVDHESVLLSLLSPLLLLSLPSLRHHLVLGHHF